MAETDSGGVKSAQHVSELLEYLAESPGGATFRRG